VQKRALYAKGDIAGRGTSKVSYTQWSGYGKKGKGSPYSITERRVPELIPVLGSQPAGDVNHKPGGRLPLPSVRPAVTLAPLRGLLPFRCLVNRDTMGVNSLPKIRQRRGCDLNPGPSASESSTLTTRLPSHPWTWCLFVNRPSHICIATQSLKSSISDVSSRSSTQHTCSTSSSSHVLSAPLKLRPYSATQICLLYYIIL